MSPDNIIFLFNYLFVCSLDIIKAKAAGDPAPAPKAQSPPPPIQPAPQPQPQPAPQPQPTQFEQGPPPYDVQRRQQPQGYIPPPPGMSHHSIMDFGIFCMQYCLVMLLIYSQSTVKFGYGNVRILFIPPLKTNLIMKYIKLST